MMTSNTMDKRMLLWKIIPGVILLAALFNARSVQGQENAIQETPSDADSYSEGDSLLSTYRDCPEEEGVPDPDVYGLEEITYWGEEVNAPDLYRVWCSAGGWPIAQTYFKKNNLPILRGPWWKGIVPYMFMTVDKNQRTQVISAMETIEAYTCLKFKLATENLHVSHCLWHARTLTFFAEPESRALRDKRLPLKRTKFYDTKGYHSRFYMMRNLSEINNCYEAYSCAGKPRLHCENDGYALSTSVHTPCRCVCLPGFDPASQCAELLKPEALQSRPFPRGPYALPLIGRECPGDGFSRKTILMSAPDNIGDVELIYCERKIERTRQQEWPLGVYCVFKTADHCPGENMHTKATTFKRMEKDRINQTVELCCRDKGFEGDVMPFTSAHPFALLAASGKQCSSVPGMKLKVARVWINHRFSLREATFHPIDNWRACSYEPMNIDCGKIYNVNRRTKPFPISFKTNNKLYACTWFIKATPGANLRLALKFRALRLNRVYNYCKKVKDNEKGKGNTKVKDNEKGKGNTKRKGNGKRKGPKKMKGGIQCWRDAEKIKKFSLEVRYDRPGEIGMSLEKKPRYTIISSHNTILIRLNITEERRARFRATIRVIKPESMCYNPQDKGVSYGGPINITREMEPCQSWYDALHCVGGTFDVVKHYDKLRGSYCRNPDPVGRIQPWCYVNAKTCEWNYCDVCLKNPLYDLRKDCYKTNSFETCPFRTGCAKTCQHLLPMEDISRRAKWRTCKAPTDLGNLASKMSVEIHDETYPIGATLTYKCKEMDKSFQRYCLTTEKWSYLGDICSEKDQIPCNDFWRDCPVLTLQQPELCGHYKDIGSRLCAYTCGYCGEPGKLCYIDLPGFFAIRRPKNYGRGYYTNRRRGMILRGDQCTTYQGKVYYPFAGKEKRICRANGEYYGEPLHCLNTCPAATVFDNVTRSCYFVFTNKYNHNHAYGVCETQDGLPSVKSKEENEALQNIKGSKVSWLGMVKQNNSWVWRMDGSPLFYANWLYGHPKRGECVVMDGQGKWRTMSCEKKKPFICRVKPTRVQADIRYYDTGFNDSPSHWQRDKNRYQEEYTMP